MGRPAFQTAAPEIPRSAPTLEMERTAGGTFELVRIMESQSPQSLAQRFPTSLAEALRGIARGTTVDSPFAKAVLAARKDPLGALAFGLTIGILGYELYKHAGFPLSNAGVQFDFSGYTHACGPRTSAETAQCGVNTLGYYGIPGTPTCIGTGIGGSALSVGSKPGGVVQGAVWYQKAPTCVLVGTQFQYEGWKMTGLPANTPAPMRLMPGTPLVPMFNPTSLIQPLNPFGLPVDQGVPAPLPEPVWPRTAADRAPNPDQRTSESPESGPAPGPSANPWPYLPSSAPQTTSVPVPRSKQSELPGVRTTPQTSPWTDPNSPPWPLEESEPGVSGPTITITGGGTTISLPKDRPPERKPKERKLMLATSKSILMRATGHFTEFLDAVEAVWDAIPQNECDKMSSGSLTETPFTTAGVWRCKGNVKNCAGKKIKYAKPLSKKPGKRWKDSSGGWHYSMSRNAYGKPVTHPRPQNMLADIINHYKDIDLCSAIENLIVNEAKDQLIGRISRRATQSYLDASQKLFSGAKGPLVGPSTGPAM